MKKPNLINSSMVALAFSVINVGCSDQANQQPQTAAKSETSTPKTANSTLNATTGHSATGTVTFTEQGKGVLISATFSGLTPGPHGFHIHAKGDCSSGDGKSAGGHFNPKGVDHGGPEADVRHIGDLGNIIADADGNASYNRLDSVVSLSGENSIVGKGMIVHAEEDDLTSQPTGAAGARVACGVIKQ